MHAVLLKHHNGKHVITQYTNSEVILWKMSKNDIMS